MHDRLTLWALLLIALVLPIAGCTSSQVDSLAVSPTSQSLSVGQTVQFTATGTTGHGSGHPSTTSDDTDSVTWTSSVPAVASVSSTGLATALTAGTTTITASMNGYTGTITASATVTVTASSSSGTGGSSGTVSSLTIIPSSQSVSLPGETTQFIAIGTTSTSATVNLTNQVSWSSSSTQIATIGASTGLATALTQGTVAIIALYTSGGSTIAGTGTFTVSNGSTEKYTAVTLVPSSQSVSLSGQTGQFIALATSGTTGFEVDVTNSTQTTWKSSIPSIATITSGLASGNGVVTGASQGSTTITAEVQNPDGTVVSATATATVTLTAAPEPLLSIVVVPTTLTTDNLYGTGQFLAYGTFSTAPTLMDITNGFYHAGFPSSSCTAALAATGTSPCALVPASWISAMPNIFPVNSSGAAGSTAGLVTADGSGNAVIYVSATNPDGTVVYSPTVTFNCPLVLPTYSGANNTGTITNPGSCNQYTIASGLLVTLTVYNAGLNTTGWLVTAPSATGTPNVIHCGPGWAANGNSGGSVCMATYPVGTTVTLTAPAETGVDFGGWSWNCESQGTVTAAGPNSCTVYLGAVDPVTGEPTSNVSVGAIFN